MSPKSDALAGEISSSSFFSKDVLRRLFSLSSRSISRPDLRWTGCLGFMIPVGGKKERVSLVEIVDVDGEFSSKGGVWWL